jgi:mono/diheme cytochrome c family protein
MAKKKKSAKESKQPDTLQPSWAAHELCALALTLVLALWVVVKYGKQTQPLPLNSVRAEERAAKLAKLRADDEKELTSYGVTDAALKRYRLPIAHAMNIVVEKGQADPAGISKEIAARLAPPSDLKLVEHPLPDFLADESELDDPSLIAQGKTLFLTKICFTCHQTDPAVPAVAGQVLGAPKYIGDFWGKETLVHKGFNGPLERVVFGPGYFYESVKTSTLRVAKGALAPMPPPPPTTDAEIMALMAYVRSLSKPE